jgi:hypothetical protein
VKGALQVEKSTRSLMLTVDWRECTARHLQPQWDVQRFAASSRQCPHFSEAPHRHPMPCRFCSYACSVWGSFALSSRTATRAPNALSVGIPW